MMKFGDGLPVYQYLATFTGTLNVMCSGMHMAWTSPSLPQLLRPDSYLPLTDDEGSWVAVMYLIGGVLGSALAGVIMDVFGRKPVIMFTSLPFIIGWILVAYAQSLLVLLLARLLAGLSDGLIFCGICMYLGEIADSRIRGFMGSFITSASLLGMLFINVLGSYLSIYHTALVVTVLPVLLLLTFSWIPESPYYLLLKNNTDKARMSLRIFRGKEDVEEELDRLKKAVEEQKLDTGRFIDLFVVKSNRNATFILMGLRVAQQWCGSIAIMFYAETVFSETGSDLPANIAVMIYIGVQIVVTLLCSTIVDKIGRKPLMITSIIGDIVALSIESCYFILKNATSVETDSFTMLPLVGLFTFVIMHSLGMQSIPLLMLGELFPTNVKAFAVGFIDIFFCVITAAASKFFQFTKDEFGLHVPFAVFTIVCVLGLIFIILYVPETKGKTLEEIQEELKGNRKGLKT